MTFSALLLPACQPLSAESKPYSIVRQETRYPVYGRTLAALTASIDEQAAKAGNQRHGGWAGYTDMEYQYDYTLSHEGERCRLHTIHITLTTTVTLPEWQDEAAADAHARSWWDTMIAQLSLHEEGHVRIAEAALPAMIRSFRAIPASTECDTVAEAVRQAMAHYETEVAQAHTEYERKTDHGRKQNGYVPYSEFTRR